MRRSGKQQTTIVTDISTAEYRRLLAKSRQTGNADLAFALNQLLHEITKIRPWFALQDPKLFCDLCATELGRKQLAFARRRFIMSDGLISKLGIAYQNTEPRIKGLWYAGFNRAVIESATDTHTRLCAATLTDSQQQNIYNLLTQPSANFVNCLIDYAKQENQADWYVTLWLQSAMVALNITLMKRSTILSTNSAHATLIRGALFLRNTLPSEQNEVYEKNKRLFNESLVRSLNNYTSLDDLQDCFNSDRWLLQCLLETSTKMMRGQSQQRTPDELDQIRAFFMDNLNALINIVQPGFSNWKYTQELHQLLLQLRSSSYPMSLAHGTTMLQQICTTLLGTGYFFDELPALGDVLRVTHETRRCVQEITEDVRYSLGVVSEKEAFIDMSRNIEELLSKSMLEAEFGAIYREFDADQGEQLVNAVESLKNNRSLANAAENIRLNLQALVDIVCQKDEKIWLNNVDSVEYQKRLIKLFTYRPGKETANKNRLKILDALLTSDLLPIDSPAREVAEQCAKVLRSHGVDHHWWTSILLWWRSKFCRLAKVSAKMQAIITDNIRPTQTVTVSPSPANKHATSDRIHHHSERFISLPPSSLLPLPLAAASASFSTLPQIPAPLSASSSMEHSAFAGVSAFFHTCCDIQQLADPGLASTPTAVRL